MRCAFLKWTLLPLALLVCTPVVGQDNQNQSNDREQRGEQAEEPDRQNQSRQTDAADRQQNDPRRQRSSSNRSQSTRDSDMSEARRHYMAGFVRGYYSGFADGLNDYLIVVGKERSSNDQGQRAARQSQDEQRLRGRLRSDAGSRARESRTREGSQQRQSQGQQRGSTQQITGEVVSVKRVELQNDRQQHMLLLIKNEQGQRRIVDAGPANRLQRLSIQSGDEITAQGRMLRTRDGVPVLNAQWIEASGQRVAVQGQRQSSSQRSRR
jgi:hypothetical protein